MENTSVAPQWIYPNYTENTSSSFFVFTACCIAMEVIQLLLAYSLLHKCVHELPSNGSTCHNILKTWEPCHKDSKTILSSVTSLTPRCLHDISKTLYLREFST
jgi:hypothetical protein